MRRTVCGFLLVASAASAAAHVAVLDMGVSGAGPYGFATPPDAFAAALGDRHEVKRVTADELSAPAFLSEGYDLLVVPCGAYFPISAADNLVAYLKAGGNLLTAGGYAFDQPVIRHGGAWMRPADLRAALPSGTTPRIFPKAAAWTRTHSGSDEEAAFTDVSAPDGSPGLQIAAPGLRFYNSVVATLPAGFFGDDDMISFLAKGSDGTPFAALELDEEDGSRWRVKVPLTDEWREVRFAEWDFSFMADRSPKARGGLGDKVRFSRVRRVNFGLTCAFIRNHSGPCGAAIANLRSGRDPDPESRRLSRASARINTRYAFIRTALFPAPEQIGVFDPSFLLENVGDVARAPEMAGVLPEAALPGRHGGYAAVGPLGLDGRGFSVNRCAWRPILSTKDAHGETWGPAAAILHHFNGTFAGSSWAFFGIDDADVFVDGSSVREKLLAPLVDKLVSRTFLHETESDWAAYDRGETAKLRTRVSNFSKTARKGRVRFALVDESGRTVCDESLAIDLPPGKTQDVAVPWDVPLAAPDILFLTAELTVDGKLWDRERTAFVVKDAKIRASLPPPRVVGDHIAFGDVPRFTVGTQNFWGQTASVTGRSPLYYYEDFRKMREYGLKWTRCSCMFANERDIRLFDALVQLAQKFGITMYWCTWGQVQTKPDDYAKKLALTAAGTARYRDVGGFMVDICNEPTVDVKALGGSERTAFDYVVKAAELMRTWATDNRAAARVARPGVLCSVGNNQGWGFALKTFDPQLSARNLDFTDRHYYRQPTCFARELKFVDRRVFGQPLVQGECGAKCHPTNKELDPRGDGDDEEGYCRRFRQLVSHAFGLGASALSIWQWRDPMEGIMAAGLMHQTNVPRPAARVVSDMAKTFGGLVLADNPPEAVMVLDEGRRFKAERMKALEEEARVIDALVWWGANFSCVSSSETNRLPKTVKLQLRAEGLPAGSDATRDALRAEVGRRLAAAGVDVTRRPGDPADVVTFKVPGRDATGWVLWNGGTAPFTMSRGAAAVEVHPGRVGYIQISHGGKAEVSREL
jgi:hypothetical protein